MGDPEAPFGASPVEAPSVGEASPVDVPDAGEQQSPGEPVRGGMPMMPPMMPPGASGGGGNERSEASGLLDAGSEPWESAGSVAGDPEVPVAAIQDGPGLEAPHTEVPSEPRERTAAPAPVGESGQVAGGMPVVPLVVPPLGGPGPNRDRERPVDSSGAGGWPPSDHAPADEVGGPAPADTTAQEVEPVFAEGDRPDLPEDHVPVVRHEDVDKDTGAWDSTGGLPWLVPFPVAGGADREREQSTSDYSMRDTAPWEAESSDGSGYAAWRRASLGGGERVAVEEQQPPRCGGPDFTPEELAAMREQERAEAERRAEAEAKAEAEAQDEEEKERSSSDLLVRDNSAWGGGSAKPPPGALG
ncbi:hypothetical protein [Saccharopolyspora gregorii]|uniref:hypothetical protein n=1 Tax=Saccharopolyspora gregorii TaxID=33914 RepID=UPI0021AC813F|nr:hypothetical protein [Saccharopolyspora gregorii]